MTEINLLDKYPKSYRPISERSRIVTDEHRRVARLFGRDYFDGDRLYGYGGYEYHPRFWRETVRRFRDHYRLEDDAKVLDVGAAKGFMLHDFKELIPSLDVTGVDISEYVIRNAIEDMKPYLSVENAVDLPFANDSFDFVISINTVHNLCLEECIVALREIERVSGGNSFISVDAWRSEEERKRLMDWNLTALTYMHVDDWKGLFERVGYEGDYYWFIP